MSGSPKPSLRLTSSLSLKNEDVEKHLLLSTSVPIKIGNDNTTKKESHKSHNRIRYTFGLRAVKSIAANSHTTHDQTQKTDAQIHEQNCEQPNLVDNLSPTNSKLVKQTTIDYYV